MSDFSFSAWRDDDQGPLAVLRDIVRMLMNALGPLGDILKSFWDRLVAFLQETGDDYNQEPDRSTWGRPELGWDS